MGEGQILAQVKRAYEHGIEETGQSGKVVSRMLNTAVTAGKRVRTETGISKVCTAVVMGSGYCCICDDLRLLGIALSRSPSFLPI